MQLHPKARTQSLHALAIILIECHWLWQLYFHVKDTALKVMFQFAAFFFFFCKSEAILSISHTGKKFVSGNTEPPLRTNVTRSVPPSLVTAHSRRRRKGGKNNMTANESKLSVSLTKEKRLNRNAHDNTAHFCREDIICACLAKSAVLHEWSCALLT